ncbi:MAG: uroporphyrinogen decarboxylase family protein, partial [Christensenellaceae bacterium]
LPHYKRLFSEYKKNGQYIIMHSCGAMIDYLPQLIDIGLDGWEPVQPCNDLKYLKREYGKDLVFWGGIDTQTLPTKTPEEVKTMAREAITILGKGGGHIIAPAQEIMNDVPLENVVALLETIVEMREKAI